MPEPTVIRIREFAAAAVAAFAPNTQPSSRVVVLRTLACLATLLAISSFVGETGRTAYTALNYPVLIYAGLSLPWPAVLALVATAAVGPNPHGSVFVTTFRDDNTVIVRPLALAIVAATSLALARSHRRSEDTLRASERRLFSFLDSMPLGVFVLSADGQLYYANDSARRLAGQPEGEVSAGNLANAFNAHITGTDIPYPEQRVPIVRALTGETSMVEDVEIRSNEHPVNLQMWGAPIRSESGEITHAVSAFSNITAQKRFEAALQESETRFRTVFEEGPLGMAMVSPDYRFVQVNQALCDMTGYRGDELVGMSFTDITHPEDHDIHTRQVTLLERGESDIVDIEKRYVRKDGGVIWVRVCVRLLRDARGMPLYHLSMIQDVTEQRKAIAEVERMANHDALTGLPNRRLLYDRLSQAIARARRYESTLLVFSIDLDGFKAINDIHGHAAGDAVLIATGKRLTAALRDTDTVARMGGDEFVLLITDVAVASAAHVARRVEDSLRQPINFDGNVLRVEASIGRAVLFEDGDSEDALITAADTAMYRAKESVRRLRAS
jgi:diguanylate cyclase (GGDEF)-like protein/PAS domain S-box-containing protein